MYKTSPINLMCDAFVNITVHRIGQYDVLSNKQPSAQTECMLTLNIKHDLSLETMCMMPF